MGYLEERANLAGKVAAVVGGAAGVGAAVTLALAKSGVDIAFCDWNGDAVDATRSEVEKLGRQVTGQVTNAWDLDQLARSTARSTPTSTGSTSSSTWSVECDSGPS